MFIINGKVGIGTFSQVEGDILSNILGLNSAPDTSIIAKMQDRLNNSLFKLSMANYELMCGNKTILKM